MFVSLFLASKMVAVVSLLWTSKVLRLFQFLFFSITFQRRSQLVIESSKGCFPPSLLAPLSLYPVFMVSAPFNLLHVENNKVAAIPSTWLAQPFEDLPPEHLLLQSGQ